MNTAIIVCGTPGAGKSTHGAMLAADRHAVLLDIDTVTEPLVRLALEQSGHSPDDRDSDHFKQTYRQPIYDTLFAIARENLPFQDVVIVGPFTREIHDPDWPARLHATLSAHIEVHYVQCDPAIRRQRLVKRGDARDRVKLADWDDYLKYYGDEEPPAFRHVLIDGA
ncbi:MAG: AAA family ATPase [Thiohalobacterales bacterium]|nr:AAA family ATPase [Thiohalobacterales bacterium]